MKIRKILSLFNKKRTDEDELLCVNNFSEWAINNNIDVRNVSISHITNYIKVNNRLVTHWSKPYLILVRNFHYKIKEKHK